MIKRRNALLAVALTASVATALSGCSGGSGTGGGSGSSGGFSTKVSGTLNAWGFNNADDVGTSRLDYAKAQLKGVGHQDRRDRQFDAQKFTTRVASGNVPDVVQMDRLLRRRPTRRRV